MQFIIDRQTITTITSQALVVGIYAEEAVPAELRALDEVLSGSMSRMLTEKKVASKFGEITVFHTWGKIPAEHVVVIGLGKREALSLDKIRAAAATAARTAEKNGWKTVHFVPPAVSVPLPELVQAAAEGFQLGVYAFTYYKTADKEQQDKLQRVSFCLSVQDAAIESALERAIIVAESVAAARDMVNHPGNVMTPARMVETAAVLAKESALNLRVLEAADMREAGMNALLAVAQGSVEPAKMIVLTYTGAAADLPYHAFVGKGITFDSGGISLKPSQSMEDMKGDMAGGAAVLAAMSAIARLKLPINLYGIVPCTENMPSGAAIKPGDIVTAMNGKTIEIINTDAEGRLILADAVSYACKLGAISVIDLATLTGACVIALGEIVSGLITNNDQLAAQVIAAGQAVGEKMWLMPNDAEYKEQIKSDVADLKNTGGRAAGMITAGLFIGEFVNDVPWVHIDIAGTSDTKKQKGYIAKGGTGVGVRTLVKLAQEMSHVG